MNNRTHGKLESSLLPRPRGLQAIRLHGSLTLGASPLPITAVAHQWHPADALGTSRKVVARAVYPRANGHDV